MMSQSNGHKPLDTVLTRLTERSGEVRQKPDGGYMAWCPAHDDQKKRSLSVAEGDNGGVVLHCFAGCTSSGPERVCEALGMTVGNLFPEKAVSISSKKAEEYVYRYADGTPAYKIRRTKNKDFYPYVYDPETERYARESSFPGSVERIPYRLEKWAEKADWIVWVEGEKDVDRLWSLGCPATTSAGGVNGTMPNLEWLNDLAVVIVPDNDKPGREYGRRVARGLAGIARSVKWLDLPDLPDKGDVSDYLDDGGTLGSFLKLARDAPPYEEQSNGHAPKTSPKKKPSKKDEPGHDELRDRWLARYPGMAWSRGDWHRYGKGYWSVVAPEVVEGQVIEILEEAREEGTRVTGHLVGSVLRLARAATFLDPALWDANADVLVLGNGTLEISERRLRGHRPEDFATSALPYDYDADADAEVFKAVIDQSVPDAHELLQEFAGYSLTTDTSLEAALWLKGPRGCGKSTVIEGFAAMLGARHGILGLAEIEASPFALAKIPGKTLLSSTEQPASYLKSTHVIDALISGEPIMVDRKYREAEQIKPVAKVIWAMNDVPRIANTTAGIFRRVHIVPFPALQKAPNPAVKEHVKDEGAGILNWALEGLQRLIERGSLVFPDSVNAATVEFEHSNDLPAQFVEEKCVTGDSFEIAARYLYNAYAEWAREGGHSPVSVNRVSEDWKRLGFVPKKTGGNRFWVGVQLRSNT